MRTRAAPGVTLLALLCAAAPLAGCDDEPAAEDAPAPAVELRVAGGRVLVGEAPAAVYFSDVTPDRIEVKLTAHDDAGWWELTGYVPVEAWGLGQATLTLSDHPADVGQANSGEGVDSTAPGRFAPTGTVTLRRDGASLAGDLSPAAGFLAGTFVAATEVSCFLLEHPQDPTAVLQPDLAAEGCAPVR